MELRSSSKLKTANTNKHEVLVSSTTETSSYFLLPTNVTIRTAAHFFEHLKDLNINPFKSCGLSNSSAKETNQHSNVCDFQLVTTILKAEVAVNKIMHSSNRERSVLVVGCEGVNF
jgi:hypothetical protein